MQHSYNFDLVLVHPHLLLQGSDMTTDARWAADESPKACAALSTRSQETIERLKKALPDLQPLPVEAEEVPDCRRASKTTQRCALNFTQAL